MKNFSIKANLKNYKGQSTLEFAMLLPFVLLILFVISQIGYVVFIQTNISQAAREGARIVCTTNSNDYMVQQIYKVLSMLDESKIRVKVTPDSPSKRAIGDDVEIKIFYRYSGFLKIMNIFLNNDLEIIGSSTMRMECSENQ